MGFLALLFASTLAAASPQARQALDALTWLQPPASTAKPPRLTLVHFWTTWCGPCLQSLPDYNRMVDTLGPEGSVRFLTVSIESPEPVRKFLGKHRIAGELALDPKSTLFQALGARSFPSSVLLDADGAVLAHADSRVLGEGVVRAALNGRPITFPVRTPRVAAPKDEVCGTESTTVEVRLQEVVVDPEKPWRSGRATRQDGFEGNALSLEMLIEQVYGARPAQIVWELIPDDLFYDVCVRSQVDGFDWKATVREVLRATYGVEVIRKVEPTLTHRLLAPAPKLPPTTKDGPQQLSLGARGSLQAGELDASGLVEYLEMALKQPVRDETKLAAPFGLDLTWDAADPNGLRDALRTVGLDLVAAMEPQERWIVRRVTP